MRILHYYPRAMVGDGGPTIATWQWAAALADRGHHVTIAYDADKPDAGTRSWWRENVYTQPVPHMGARRVRVPVFPPSYQDPDVLILHSAYVAHNLVAGRWARTHGVPYVVVPHGAYDAQLRRRRATVKRVWERMERPYLKFAAAVHVFYDAEVPDVHAMAPNVQLIVAPTGISVPQDTWQGGEPVVWIGRYDITHKGLDLLFEGMALIPSAQRPRLDLYGKESKDTAADVRQLAYGLEVDAGVHGPVFGDDKVKVLTTSRGYIHPSRWESHGIALFENLALGVPCAVSSAVPVSQRLGDAAVVFDPNPQAVADALLRLGDRQMGERGRRYVADEFSWDTVAERFERQLLEVVN